MPIPHTGRNRSNVGLVDQPVDEVPTPIERDASGTWGPVRAPGNPGDVIIALHRIAALTVAAPIMHVLDRVASITREYFGLQRRLLREGCDERDYSLSRLAAFADFRKRLADLYIDATLADPTVVQRLHAFCRDLLGDARRHAEAMSDVEERANARMRRKPRPEHPSTPASLEPAQPLADRD